MKSQKFFSSSAATQIVIYPDDVKKCLDEYKHNKTPSCVHPVSKFMKELQNFYNDLGSEKKLAEEAKNITLNNDQLYYLAGHLYSLEHHQYDSPKSYAACKTLYTAMGFLVNYASADKRVFNQFSLRPKLYNYIQSIEKRMFKIYLDEIIINYPDALEFIAKSKTITKTMLNPEYCAKIKDYRYLVPVCNAIDRLNQENEILYNNIQAENTYHEQVSNKRDFLAGGYYYKTAKTTSTVYHNRSKNLNYKASLNSQANIDFIFNHPDHADLIVDVLVRLHEAMIGKAYQEQAETYLATLMDKHPEVFLHFSEIFLSKPMSVLDQLKRTFNEEQFHSSIKQAVFAEEQSLSPSRKLYK